MRRRQRAFVVGACLMAAVVCAGLVQGAAGTAGNVELPDGVKAVWDLGKARREATATRERFCINGLWRIKPARAYDEPVPPPDAGWGYFKVPGPWPGGRGGDQAIYPHPDWQDRLGSLDCVWFVREVAIPQGWEGRRIGLSVDWLNSYARVFVDGVQGGDIIWPGGEADITSACRPGRTQQIAVQVFARSLTDQYGAFTRAEAGPNRARSIGRRGMVGDVFLTSAPAGARIDDVKVDTSVRKWALTLTALLHGLDEGKSYRLRARVLDGEAEVLTAESRPFTSADLENDRFSFSAPWRPDKLWDTDAPENTYDVALDLLEGGALADAYHPVRFGFREFWIEGRDFYLNGSRVHLRAVPIDSAQIGPANASYAGARETMERFRWLGFNAVYTHNYGCSPGAHLGFEGLLKAADDLGMLLCFSLPQMSRYDWENEDSVRAYVRHVEWYVRQSQNHPAVVMYSQNHNYMGFAGNQNPQLLARGRDPDLDDYMGVRIRDVYSRERFLRQFDKTHPQYNHAGPSRELNSLNCYLNWVPMQERAEWFWPWAREGAQPLFLVEYGEPLYFSYSSLRTSWEEWRRPTLHQYFFTEWGAQLRGDAAYDLSEFETVRLRWEADRWRRNAPFLRWNYPMGEAMRRSIPNLRGVQAEFIARTWPAFRTLGLSGFNIWHPSTLCYLRDGVQAETVEKPTDWEDLQRPGLSIDRARGRDSLPYSMATQRTDWVPNVRGAALRRYNRPLLAYIAGKAARFTERGNNFLPGQTVEKQVIVVNDSRRPVECAYEWSVSLPREAAGAATLAVPPGENGRAPLRFDLPAATPPGEYEMALTARFDTGEVQEESFTLNVLAPRAAPKLAGKVALFDPKGETAALLGELGVPFDAVDAEADLDGYDVLVIGKKALTVDGPAPDLSRVRDGLRAVVFEQEALPLERRLGFRVQEYGLRRVFPRAPGHPILAGLSGENLHDWHGEATLVPPSMPAGNINQYAKVQWCGFAVTRPDRAGCQGNVSSVMIERPARGDFLPLVQGGFALQYSPLMVYREGRGAVVFCQMDVTGRTEDEPAARRLVANILEYVDSYAPSPARRALYAGAPEGMDHLKAAQADVELYDGQPLSDERVLVLGPGAAEALGSRAGQVAAWVRAGGRVLALGLSQADAGAALSLGVQMEEKEHVSSFFEPPGADSILAGVGCSDVMTRDPRTVPLIVGGARALGDGVLARSEEGNVAFFQMVPWQFDYVRLHNAKMAFQHGSFVVSRLLGNMGVALRTPLLERFGSPLVLPLEPPDEVIGHPRIEREDKAVLLPTEWKGLPVLEGEAPAGWPAPGFDDSAWRDVRLGSGWETQFEDLVGFDGVFLYRAELTVPPGLAEGGATLVLGAVDDEDRTYVNGRLVGSITRESNPSNYWEAARRYELPPGALKPGRNTIAVEVTDLRQVGGLLGFKSIQDIPPVRVRRENKRWLDGLYLDEPAIEDDPYRYFRW